MKQDQPQDIKKVRGRSNGGKKSKTQIRIEEVSPNKTSDAETKHVSLPDLNHSGKVNDETKTSVKRRVPLFDLNQISVSTSSSFTITMWTKRLQEDKETNLSLLSNCFYREKKKKKKQKQ